MLMSRRLGYAFIETYICLKINLKTYKLKNLQT